MSEQPALTQRELLVKIKSISGKILKRRTELSEGLGKDNWFLSCDLQHLLGQREALQRQLNRFELVIDNGT